MTKAPSIASNHSAYAQEAPAQPARAHAAPRPAFSPVTEDMRDRFDPSVRTAETAVNNGANPTVLRYLAMEKERSRLNEKKSPFGRLWQAMKPKARDRRSMDRLMHSEAALKNELRTLNAAVDTAWQNAQRCYQMGDAKGAGVYNRLVIDYSKKANDVQLSLATVQGDEDMLVKQMSSGRLMKAHADMVRALKNKPDETQQLEERLKIMDEVKDRTANNDELLREKIEQTPDDDVAMQFLMQKLAQSAQANLETEEPVRPVPQYNEGSDQWEALYNQ